MKVFVRLSLAEAQKVEKAVKIASQLREKAQLTLVEKSIVNDALEILNIDNAS